MPGRKKRVAPPAAACKMAACSRETDMTFRFTGLPLAAFEPLFALTDRELAARQMRRVTADQKPGYPCRVTLEDAEPGERLILLSYEHQAAATPYRAAGPIFVREAAATSYDGPGVPPVLQPRRLSLRAYDATDSIIAAEVVMGEEIEVALERLFARPACSYVHAHNAGYGCYAGRIDRG